MTNSDADYVAYVQGRLPALRRLAYHLSGDSHQADDLVQETIAKLYAVWGRISLTDGLDTYTRTTLVRVFLDEKRRGWWRVRLFGAIPERAGAPPPGVEERVLLSAALRTCRPGSRPPWCCGSCTTCRSPRSPGSSAVPRAR